MKTLAFVMITLLFSLICNAQELKGEVTDATSKEQLVYATVAIKDTLQQKVISFAYTDDKGKFKLTLPNQIENTQLMVQYMGYETYIQYLDVHNLPDYVTISLAPASNNLDAVTVTQRQQAITLKGDKLIFNIEQVGIGTGNNGLETMEQLPGIRLDKDENIVFRGSTGVQIMINGKKSLLEGTALKEYLRTLQGDEIASVEIIAQPSARYDASGTTGIINIVLKKGKKPGINGSVYAQGSYGEYYKEAYGGRVFYTDSVWNINANGYYYDGNSVNHREVKQSIVLDEGLRTLNQKNEWLPQTISKNVNLGVERTLSKNQLLSTEWQYVESLAKENTYGTTIEKTNDIVTDEVMLTQYSYAPKTNVNGNLYYNFTSDSATTTIDAQVNYAYYNKKLNGSQTNDYANESTMELLGVNKLKYNIINSTVDFNQDITKEIHVEAGAKFAHIAMNYYNEYDTNNTDALFIPEEFLINDFDYTENLWAGYTQLAYNKDKWSLLAGLRVEHYGFEATSNTSEDVNKNNYTNWFPSFSVNYKQGDHQYQFAYSRRIGRPSYLELNPYYVYLDAYTLSTGNPQLQPRLYHSLQLSYIYKNAVNLSLYGYLYENGFVDVIDYIETQNYNVTYKANASNGGRVGLSASIPYEIKDWWGVQLNADAAYNYDSANIPEYTYNGHGFGFDLSLYQKFNLPKSFVVNLNSFYSGRGTDATGYSRPYFDMSFSVSKYLLNEKMRIVGGCSNVLKNSYYSHVSTVNNVTTDWTNRWETRRFYMQLTYYFGSKKDTKSIKGSSLSDEKNRM